MRVFVGPPPLLFGTNVSPIWVAALADAGIARPSNPVAANEIQRRAVLPCFLTVVPPSVELGEHKTLRGAYSRGSGKPPVAEYGPVPIDNRL